MKTQTQTQTQTRRHLGNPPHVQAGLMIEAQLWVRTYVAHLISSCRHG